MKHITLSNGEVLPLREKQTSSFDYDYAGQHGDDGEYYILLSDYKTHEHYCVLRGTEIRWDEKYVLKEGEQKEIYGNLVRGMTWEEECAYNEDRLLEVVDKFGNISVTEEFDMKWYMENCI